MMLIAISMMRMVLNQTGYFTINPLVAPGCKTIAHIKEEIEEHHVNCLLLNLNSHQK